MTIDEGLLAAHALGATRGEESWRIEESADSDDRQILERHRSVVRSLDDLLAAEAPRPRRHVWVRILEELD